MPEPEVIPETVPEPTWVLDGMIRGRCLTCQAATIAHEATPEGEQAVADAMKNHHATRHTPPPVPGAPSEQ